MKFLRLTTMGFLLLIPFLIFPQSDSISKFPIAQTTIIERPQFATANTDAFEISKLELKNSETVLYCDGYGKPNDIISLSSKVI